MNNACILAFLVYICMLADNMMYGVSQGQVPPGNAEYEDIPLNSEYDEVDAEKVNLSAINMESKFSTYDFPNSSTYDIPMASNYNGPKASPQKFSGNLKPGVEGTYDVVEKVCSIPTMDENSTFCFQCFNTRM